MAAFVIRILSSAAPGRSELAAALDAAAWANARWIADERGRGGDPPCCPRCGEITYLADIPSSNRATFATGGELLARKRASCGEVAAYVLGKRRADAGARGLDANAVGVVELVDRGPGMLHAVVRLASGEVLDETKEMH